MELQPDSVDAHYNIGYSLRVKKSRADDVSHFLRVIETKPDYS